MDSVSSSRSWSRRISANSTSHDSDTPPPSRRRGSIPDSPDTVVSIASIQRSQTRRRGHPENTGALSANPRVEREVQHLCNELERTAEKLARLRARAPLKGGSEAAIAARIEALRATQRELGARLKEFIQLLDPDTSGTIMERAKSQATCDLEQTFLRVWQDYQRTQKASCTKYLWTFLSGGIAYSIPFGIGTMLGRGLEKPYLVLVAGPLHTLAEPLWTMVRATTWTNPASEAYVGRQRARARANGDAWRYLARVQPKTKMLWTDPVTGKRALLTAAQALATNQELWLWLHKMVSDDLPFFIFSILYAAKNMLGDFYGPALFDRNTPDGLRNDLLAQFADGFLCGALAMLSGQSIRRLIAHTTGGIEVVTRSLHIWKLQASYLRSYSDDLKDKLSVNNLPKEDARLLRAKLREVETELAKASAKSTLRGSIGYEFSVMFQKKRMSSGSDPDMPGKRLDTMCSILGKTTSLLPSLAASYLCQPFARSPERMTRMIAHLVVPFALVAWPGFGMRTELQDWYRSLFGACKGMASAMRAGCCCAPEDPDGSGGSDDDDGNDEEREALTKAVAGSPYATDMNPDGGSLDDEARSGPDSDSVT